MEDTDHKQEFCVISKDTGDNITTLASDNGKAKYKCDTCEKIFCRASNLFFHKRSHNGERLFGCKQCDKRFSSLANLTRHQRSHDRARPYKCDYCNRTFVLLANLANHQKSYNGIKCKNAKHQPVKVEPTMAEIKKEDISLSTASSQEQPSQTETKNYQNKLKQTHKCFHCGKIFSSSVRLTSHLIDNHGGEPFKCKICQKEFKYSSGLSRHKRSHESFKPPEIPSRKLKVNDVKLYQCDLCHKVFAFSSGLSRHKIGHRPKHLYFRCCTCNHTFKQPSYLVKHLMSEQNHDVLGHYECNFCQKHYKYLSLLNHHEQLYHAGKMLDKVPHEISENGVEATETGSNVLLDEEFGQRKSVSKIAFNVGGIFSINDKVLKDGRDSLATGVSTVTVVGEERSCVCKACKKSFTKESILEAHQKSCTGKKSYSCKRCHKCFNQLCDFLSHQREHSTSDSVI